MSFGCHDGLAWSVHLALSGFSPIYKGSSPTDRPTAIRHHLANGNPWRGKNALVQTLNLARLSHGKSRSAAYAVAQHPAWFTVQTIHIACIVRVS
jgi:hypothetical protein